MEINEKLSIKEKIGYALGDGAANIAWRGVSTFLFVFYVDVFGLDPVSVGLLMLVARSSDGLSDVFMGLCVGWHSVGWYQVMPGCASLASASLSGPWRHRIRKSVWTLTAVATTRRRQSAASVHVILETATLRASASAWVARIRPSHRLLHPLRVNCMRRRRIATSCPRHWKS